MKFSPPIGRYKDIRILHEGAHSVVYRAEMPDGSPCALKIFRSTHLDKDHTSSESSRLFLSELEVLSICDHPNLIRLLEFGQVHETGHDFLAMEWFDGQDLVRASANITRTHFHSILAQVCRGLDFLHTRGLVHGDLKPGNILVSFLPEPSVNSRAVKLLDLSYSVPVGTSTTHRIQGSPHYIAPEIIQGFASSPQSDLYSLGVILYECLSGTLPYAGGAVSDILSSHIQRQPPPLPGSISSGLQSLTYQLMSKDPLRRPSSAAEVMRLLDSAYDDSPIEISTVAHLCARLSSTTVPSRTLLRSQIASILHSSVRANPHSSRDLLLLFGSPGAGKTRTLRELALLSRTIGFTVHFADTCQLSNGTVPEPPIQRLGNASNGHRPLFVAIDIHSVDTLNHVAPYLDSLQPEVAPLVAVVACDPSVAPTADLSHALDLLSRSFSIRQFTLSPFDREDIASIAQSMCAIDSVQPEALDQLVLETGGRPDLLALFFAAALSTGSIGVQHRVLTHRRSLAPNELPAPLALRLTGLLDSMSELETRIAQIVAASTEEWPAAHMVADLTNSDLRAVLAHCITLVRKGVLHERQSGAEMRIACGLIRSHLLRSLSELEARSIHLSLGNWYESHPATGAHYGYACHHFRLAGIREKTLSCALRAATYSERSGDPSNAAHLYRLAIECTPDSQALPQAVLGLSRALNALGQFNEAASVLDKVAMNPHLPPTLACELELARASAASGAGDFHLMQASSSHALQISDKYGLLPESLDAALKLGCALCNLERINLGKPFLFRASTTAQRMGHRDIKSKALGEIAACHWKRGQYRRALRYQSRSLRLRHAPDPRLASELTRFGILQCDLGFFAKARKTHNRARAYAREAQSGGWEWIASNNIGETLRAQGRWKHAAKVYLITQAGLKGSGACFATLTVAYNVASTLARVGYYSEAVAGLRNLMRLARSLGSVEGTCGVLSSWATVLVAAGRLASALRAVQKAEGLAKRWNLFRAVLELKTIHALILSSISSPEEGRRLLASALEEYEELSPFDVRLGAHLAELQIEKEFSPCSATVGDRLRSIVLTARRKRMAWHLTWALVLRGQVLLATGHPEEAQKVLEEAICVAQKNADRPQFWQSNYWLGRVFEQKLQYERALGAYRVAALTINELAMDLDDDRYREPFLAQPAVREAQARYERLRAEVGRKARHDIAAMSRSEKISRRMLNALNAIGQKLTSILDLDVLLTQLLDLSIENVRAERGMVFLRDSATSEMRLACARNMDKETLEEVSTFSQSVIRQVAAGHTLLQVDVGSDSSLSAYKSLVIHEIKSILCVPMRTRGETVGVIYLDTRRAAQMFTDKERTFVESFASQAAIAIENARQFGGISEENARLKREAAGRSRFENLIGVSPAMQKLSEVISGVAASDCNVLVVGESGTGKELVARAIHCAGPRQQKTFVAIDCGALPESLLEAELFGFVRGAFTGADRDKTGLIEEAHGGTLFLDEISNTSLALQAKLLRALQEHEVRRVGDNAPRRVDVRVVAATNGDVTRLMKEGKFRSDLYYRLNVVTIEVPPLRDRREDIPLLVAHFLKKRAPNGAAPKRLASGVIEALSAYDWPGNVRQLENVVERLVVLTPGAVVTRERLPEEIRVAAGLAARTNGDNGGNGHKTGEHLMVEEALRRFKGDKAKAARYIGWNRQKLYRKMKLFDIAADYGRAV